MRANPGPRLPLQPNPFGSLAIGTPWADELADVPSINDTPFQLVIRALQQMRLGAKGTSIVLTGDPGSGKTHLLGRLRARLREDQRAGAGDSIYTYVRCSASAGTLWRHLQHALASDLLQGPDSPQLQAVLQRQPNRLEQVKHGGLRRILECLRDGRHFHLAAGWLRGEKLGAADRVTLGFPTETDDEDQDWEREAKLIVSALLSFLAPTTVVLCFDQVEALETYRGDEAGFHAMGQVVAELYNGHNHLLLISCIVNAFEHRLDRLPNDADRDRWLQYKGLLRPIDWEQATQLIRMRLDNAPALKKARAAHSTDPLWPLNADALQLHFVSTGFCLPRTLIRACKEQFDDLMNDQPAETAKRLEMFLQDGYEHELKDSRRTVAQQSLNKTLTDLLPWLLQNSSLLPVGHDEARSRYANQAWRGPQGDIALAFCDGSGNALTSQIRRINQSWTGKQPRLLVLRDAAVRPGAKGAELLEALKKRGAQEIHPLPEALAALHAIRSLVNTARSGELYNGDEAVSEQAVTDWALAHLPTPVAELRAALTGKQRIEEDPLLPRLSALLNERKIMSAQDAATELQAATEEVRECASRHPMRFGLLVGPPVVVFEAIQTSAR